MIDEYDVPLTKSSEKDTAKNGYYTKMRTEEDNNRFAQSFEKLVLVGKDTRR